MKSAKYIVMAALTALVGGATCARAADVLKIGDPAPKLQVGKWVQGDPVTGFDKDKAYIVEFRATWCGPCRASIPHLNEIYSKYKDKGLVVVGQNCWEQDESKVGPFVKQMGDKMTYRVALDDKKGSEKGKMAETWMEAAGQNGIPSAFLVDKTGTIAWIGHPMTLKEKTIDDVLAGTYDVKAAAADFEKEHKDEIAMQRLNAEIGRAMQKKDWDTANQKIDEMEKLMPEGNKGGMDFARLHLNMMKGDYDAAYQLSDKISNANKDNAQMQNELAWQILTDKTIKQRDLDRAEKYAQRGSDAADGKDPSILDTLARAKFMNGKKDDAIALQEKAVAGVEGKDKAALQKTLDSYKQGKLPDSE